MKFLLVLLLSCACILSYSQTFKGKVVDGPSGEFLEYANIGVVGKNIGGISLRNGEFSIDLSRADKRDVVKVSYLGYESFTCPVDSLNFDLEHVIRLQPKTSELNTVVISENAANQIVGNTKVGRTFTGWGDFQSLRGRTRGLLIQNLECPVKVKSFSFRINHNDWDSVSFRLNFLAVDGQKPGESLLHQNIFVTTSQRHKWVKVDLDQYNIILCSQTIATLEWVDAWGKLHEHSNMLTLSFSKNSGHLFIKEANEETGKLEPVQYAPAMQIEVYGN